MVITLSLLNLGIHPSFCTWQKFVSVHSQSVFHYMNILWLISHSWTSGLVPRDVTNKTTLKNDIMTLCAHKPLFFDFK